MSGFEFNEGSFDFFGLVPSDEDLDTPIRRVFVLFKVLLINLVLGCLFTVFCLSIKKSIGKCLNLLCCGFCDDCDCDYDGSHYSRSRYRRPRRTRKQEKAWEMGFQDSVAYALLLMCKNFVSNKRLVKKTIFALMGIFLAYNCFTSIDLDSVQKAKATTPIHSCSSSGDAMNCEVGPNDPKRVYFVMPTAASALQKAKLTRVAQMLYPNRHFVTWIIVSTDPIQQHLWLQWKIEHWSSNQILEWKRDEKRVLRHLEDLRRTVARFGITFVILSSHQIHHVAEEFTREQLKLRQDLSRITMASYVGVSWVADTKQNGILFLGSDDGTYDGKLLPEVQKTKQMSAWPIGLDLRYRVGLSTPLIRGKSDALKGYFSGGRVMEHIPLQYGGYALNLQFVKTHFNLLDKITFDGLYTSNDLNVTEVKPSSSNLTRIYFWKTATLFIYSRYINKQPIPLKLKWVDTNVQVLLSLVDRLFAKDLIQ